MQTESLRYFATLARAGSFNSAAKELFISQQGLNKAISVLERELDMKLVERSTRGIRLTSSGETLLAHAEVVLRDYDELIKALYAEYRSASASDARIKMHFTYYVAQIAVPFIDRMNALDSVNVIEESFARILDEAVESDGTELFLVDLFSDETRRLAAERGLVFEPVVTSRFGVVCQETSPLAGLAAIHRDQLADYPLAVDSQREMLRMVDCVMEGYTFNNVRLGVANPRATLEYATTSDQVAATFDSFGFYLAQKNPAYPTDGLRFIPLSTPRAVCEVGFLYPKAAKPLIRARHAIDALKRHLAAHCGDYEA